MQYKKGGRVFCPKDNYDWMHYYAGPVSSVEFPDFIRVYFSTRGKIDEKGHFQTLISYVDCDKGDPLKILNVKDRYLLELGRPGTFDEHGTMVADVIFHEDKYFLYYMGWQRSDTVPYTIRLGLAISFDGSNFTKVSEGPIIGFSKQLPFGIGNVTILHQDEEFHMWYTHYLPWIKNETGYKPTYEIRYATSNNGIDWVFKDTCLPYLSPKEVFATPCVRYIDGLYHMWYSYREAIDKSGNNGKYSIGYATSDDKINWHRKDNEIDIHLNPASWEEEMICYPDVIQLKHQNILFYCGNRYGESGFGYATFEL